MLLQSFLLGMSYYSYLYYLPLYYQNVHNYSILLSAVLLLPLVITQSVFSVISGQYLSRLGRYGELLWSGFGIWLLGAGLLITCSRNTSAGTISGFLVLVGVGVGFTFQPTIVALQAHCTKAQRAVIISNRNLLRSLGGAVGLAISSALTGNTLGSSLPAHLQYVAASTFALPDLDTFSVADRIAIEEAYASASRAVFIFVTPVIGVAFLCNAFVKDKGLQRKEEKVEAQVEGKGVADDTIGGGEQREKGITEDVDAGIRAGEVGEGSGEGSGEGTVDGKSVSEVAKIGQQDCSLKSSSDSVHSTRDAEMEVPPTR